MNSDSAVPTNDPFFGNSVSDLMRAALEDETALPDSAADQWHPPTTEHLAEMLPQYSIMSLIGRGGMGAVYHGIQLSLNRPVAIKLLPTELAGLMDFVTRFEREARMLGRLQHAGIVAVYDFGHTPEGHLYFVMEYVDGADLQGVIHAGLEPLQALDLTLQICEALQYAHSQGVIHRDIKPANVLLTRDGRAKLADFGLARPLTTTQGMTAASVIMGTPEYMAPEQWEGKVDHRADIYALGVMLYEMLTGKRPQGAFDLPSMTARVDSRLDEVVVKAMRQAPDQRYQKVSELRDAVHHIQTTRPPRQVPARANVTAPNPVRQASLKAKTRLVERRRSKAETIGWLAVITLLIACAGGAAWVTLQKQSEKNPLATKSERFDDVETLPSARDEMPPSPPGKGEAGTSQGIIPGPDAGQVLGWLETAASLAGQIPVEKGVRNRFYQSLSRAYTAAGRFDIAIKMAENINDLTLRKASATGVCVEMALRGQFQEALRMAKMVTGISCEDAVRAKIASLLLQRGEIIEAKAMSQPIRDPLAATLFLMDVAVRCLAAKDQALFTEKTQAALAFASSIGVQEEMQQAFQYIVVSLVEANQVPMALESSSFYRGHRYQSPVFDIIEALAKKGEFAAAVELLQSCGFTKYPSCVAGAALSRAYAAHGRAKEAESIAGTLAYDDHAAKALVDVYVLLGRLEEAIAAADRLRTTSHLDGSRDEDLGIAVAKTIALEAWTKGFATALLRAEKQDLPTVRALSLIALGESCKQPSRPATQINVPYDPAAFAGLVCSVVPPQFKAAPYQYFENHRYQFVERRCSWLEARDVAAKLGGHLATLNSPEEHDWVVRIFSDRVRGDYGSAFLGGKYENQRWEWTTQEPFVFTNWHPGEPAGRGPVSYMDLQSRGNAIACCTSWGSRPNNSKGFIVEWESDHLAAGTQQPVPAPPPASIPVKTPTVSVSSCMQLIKDQVPKAAEWALSPLEVVMPGDIRQSVILLREDLIDEQKVSPKASAEAYKLATDYCDKLLAALSQREVARVNAGYRAAQADANKDFSNQALDTRRNYKMSWPQYAREESQRATLRENEADKADVKKERIKMEWAERTQLMRLHLDGIYRRVREAIR